MLEYRRDIRMGFSFYYTMGSFILTIPIVGAIFRLRDSDAFGALFFGDKWGFSIQFELVSFFFGKRRWRWLDDGIVLGGGMLISLDDGHTWFEIDRLKVKTQATEETESEIFTIVETGVRATAYLTDGSVYTEGEASWEQIIKQMEV